MTSISFVTLTTAYLLAMNFLLAAFVVSLLKSGGASKLTRSIAWGCVALWNAALWWRLSLDSLFSPDVSHVLFGVVLFGFAGLVTATLLATPATRLALSAIPVWQLLLPQGMRAFFGAGFLVSGALGLMPVTFSVLDGLFHITSAVLALLAAARAASDPRHTASLWVANMFGLTDIVLVALGIPMFLLADVGPNHNMMYAAFFAAPLSVALHTFSMLRLGGVLATASKGDSLTAVVRSAA